MVRRAEQVVELGAARVDLQPVDDGEAAVVADDEDHLLPGHHRRVDVRVHHQVRAVADPGDDVARSAGRGAPPRPRRSRSPSSSSRTRSRTTPTDLRAPAHGELAGQAAGRRQDVVVRVGRGVDRLDHLGVGGRSVVRSARTTNRGRRATRRCARRPRPATRPGRHRRRGPTPIASSATLASPTTGRAPCLWASHDARIDRHEPHVRILEHRPRAGREVLQPGTDRQHDIGLLRDGVGRARPGHAERAGVVRVVVGQGRLAGHRLDDRDGMALREGRAASSTAPE